MRPTNDREVNMSGKSFKQITQDVNMALAGFREAQPDTMAGFSTMSRAALQPGVLSGIDKELIALCIGVAGHCDACIGFHVKALIRLGVTREQLTEALSVAVYMGGGPSLMYAAEAMRAFEEFS